MDNSKILKKLRKIEKGLNKALNEVSNNPPVWEAYIQVKALANKIERTTEYHRTQMEAIMYDNKEDDEQQYKTPQACPIKYQGQGDDYFNMAQRFDLQWRENDERITENISMLNGGIGYNTPDGMPKRGVI